MREALECRELLGHEDHPKLFLEDEETNLATLADPLPFSYGKLTGKRLDEHSLPGTLVSLSHRRAIVEVTGVLPLHTNIMLRLEVEAGEEKTPELFAKVMHPIDESGKCYLIHFTSLPPGIKRLLEKLKDKK